MKAPDFNIKDVLKKLSFLKNNLGLLVPIVIVVVALLLLLIPTPLLGRRLRQTMEKESVSVGRKVGRLARDVNSVTDAETLESYIDAYTKDANAIDVLVAQMAQRELLSYDLFPDTNETSIALYEAFGRQYRLGVEAMLERMDAGACPSDAEIKAALKSAPRPGPVPGGGYGGGGYGGDAYGGGGYGGGAYGGGGMGMGRRFGMMTPTSRKIVDQICEDRARAAGVYAALGDVAGYAYWAAWEFENKDVAYKDCWYWQLGYWIIEDITETIRVMNDGSAGVLEAPVKRFSEVDFRMKRGRTGGGRGRGMRRKTVEDTNPIYATDTKDALTTPCTGRFTGEEIDVVQFNVRLVVEVDQVVPFMQELSSDKTHKFRGFYGKQPEKTYMHNQISVLESSVGPIDPESINHDMYRYGDTPVVELSLLCEYVFYKTPAFEGIKPQQIKDELAGEEEEV